MQGQTYTVRHYRPRIEGLFAQIERWTNNSTNETHWKSVSKDNVTSLYGWDASTRIADPDDPLRVFSWLLSITYDDVGNVIVYRYKAADNENVSPAMHELHREVCDNATRLIYGATLASWLAALIYRCYPYYLGRVGGTGGTTMPISEIKSLLWLKVPGMTMVLASHLRGRGGRFSIAISMTIGLTESSPATEEVLLRPALHFTAFKPPQTLLSL